MLSKQNRLPVPLSMLQLDTESTTNKKEKQKAPVDSLKHAEKTCMCDTYKRNVHQNKWLLSVFHSSPKANHKCCIIPKPPL